MTGPARLWPAAGLGAVLLVGQAAADVVQRPQSNVTIPGAVAAPAPAEPAQPDERPLWRLLDGGEEAELRARLSRLRLAYPAWIPPARMLAILDRAQAERELAGAKRARDWTTLRVLAASHPDMVACARPDDAAMAVAATPEQAPAALDRALLACADADQRVALLAAAFDRAGPGPVAAALAAIDPAGLSPAAAARLADLRLGIALQGLGEALDRATPGALDRALAQAPAIRARRDGGLAAALGWALLKAGRPAPAADWFAAARSFDPRQSAEGLARAHLAQGRPAEALADGALPPGLLAEIQAARIDAAFRRGDDRGVIGLAAAMRADPPLALGWSLYRRRDFAPAGRAFEDRYRRHGERAAAEGLLMSLSAEGRFTEALAAAGRHGGAVRTAFAPESATGYDLHLAWLRAALAQHDDAAAQDLARLLAPRVQARQDPAAATTIGWAALQADRPAEAAGWFAMGDDDDARYGAALARYRLGDGLGAARLAAAQPPSARWRRLRGDALMQQAQRDPTGQGVALAQEALVLDPGRRDAALLLAWHDRRAGRRDAAAASFAALYRAQPDADSAAGLAESAPAASLAALAQQLGGPLQDAARRKAAADSYARKDFRTAWQIDPALHPELSGLDSPQIGIGFTGRSKSGAAGTSRLASAASDLQAGLTDGDSRFGARLHLVSLDAGADPQRRLTTRLDLGVEPMLSWEKGGALLEIGTTPFGGAVDPTPQGRAAFALQLGGATIRLAAYRQAVTESVLSYTGVQDRLTGQRHGRVTETGGQAETYLPLATDWGLYLSGAAGIRDGVAVQSNLHVQAAATLSYELKPAGFDSLTIGPSYRFSRFEHDLSGFAPGQGGYYSPAASHGIGAALRLLTAEARDLVVAGEMFAGWQFARSTAPPSRQDGFNGTAQVTAAYRIAGNWQLGAMLRGQLSPQYHDFYAGLALTYSLGARKALVSADLPRFDQR